MTGAAALEALASLGPTGIVAAVGLVLIRENNKRLDAIQRDANERADRQFATVAEVADRYSKQSEHTAVAIERLTTLIGERMPGKQ